MNIVFAILKLRPMGGKERDFVGLVDLFASRGHAVIVLIGEAPAHAFKPGIEVRVLKVGAMTNHGRQQAFSDAVCRFRNEARACDALIGFEPLACADFVFAAVRPFAARALGWRRLLPRYRTLMRLERTAFGPDNGPGLFFLCAAQAKSYREVCGTPPARSFVLPVSFGAGRAAPDVFYASRQEVRERLSIPAHAPVLIHVAVNGYLKGLDRVIDLLAHAPGVFLISLGEASQAMRRRAARRAVSERTRFIGPTEDVPRLVGAADLTVHPAREEAAGLVITESLLYGVPVIASGECGYADQVERARAGAVLAIPFDQEAFLAVILTALKPERLAQLKAAAREYSAVLMAEGGLPRVADTMLQIIERDPGRLRRSPQDSRTRP